MKVVIIYVVKHPTDPGFDVCDTAEGYKTYEQLLLQYYNRPRPGHVRRSSTSSLAL